MEFVKKIFKRVIGYLFDDYIDRIALRTAYFVERDIYYKFFSDIGLEDLKKIVEQGEKNRREKGHTDYMDLASLYKEMINKRK